MRKMIAALLAAATLATPALAQRGRDPGGGGFQPAPERTVEQREPAARPAAQAQPREFRQERQDFRRQQFQNRQVQSSAVTGQQDRVEGTQERRDWQRDRTGDRSNWQQNRQNWQQDRQDWQRNRPDWNREDGQGRQDWQQNRRDWQRDREDWQRNRQDWQRDRNWNDNNRWQGNRNWSRDWRRDPRYNWQDWRQRNRGSYNFPRYYAPRGWGYGYQRFSFGAFLGAPFFTQDYWIDDPFEYRLPPAYGPYRWVRYYDDVLLVDIRNGQVVDVIHDFFW